MENRGARRLRACNRCRARHSRCDASVDTPCRSCKRANTPCTGRGQTVFRVLLGDPKTTLGVRISSSPEATDRPSDSCSAGPRVADFVDPAALNGYQRDGEFSPSQTTNATTYLAANSRNQSVQNSLSPLIPHPQDTNVAQSGSLKNLHEAQLFKYFITYLSLWFDYCDPGRQFCAYISSNASINPTLLKAVLACSARHKSAKIPSYIRIAEEYQHDCLETLIPALSENQNGNPDGINDMLFVSALLFRFLEEMTEPADKECRSHVMSAELLLRILDDNLCSSLLTDAALIVVLRQDIFIANLTQRPVGPLANRCNIDRSLTPTSDVMWAYRIMSHAAEITNFVYSEESDRSTPTWDKLMAYAKDWENCRPNSFTPLFQSQTAPPTFPNPVFASDCHVAGHQYLGLCRILLLACDPHIPMLGMNGMRMLQERDEKTRDYVRDICGTAMANSECFPAVSTAGLVIGMCGEMFSDPEETGVLLELIAGAEGHLRWHHLKSKESLQRFWGLSGS